jgi:diguanylate cyclase (GGDEF)-like protein
MQQAPTILVIFLYLTAMLMVYLAAWAQLRSRIRAAREFSWLMCATILYTLGYAIEISRYDLPGILEAIKFEYLGIAMIPALMLNFALRFIGKKLRWYAYAFIFAVPIITIVLVLTVEYHEWFYINPRVVQGLLFPVITFERGFWYYIHFAYLQIAPSIASILLIVHALRAGAKYRKQAVMIAVGSSFPLFAGILYLIGFIQKIDPAPFSLFLTGLMLSIALFKFGLFELVPAARELAIDSIRDGFLVIDYQGRLQDLNNAAWRLPGASELKIGDPLPLENALVNHLRPLLINNQDAVDFSVDSPENGSLYFHATSYPILTKTGTPGGSAILINDVTESTGLMRQLNQMASTDELTGILNRRFLIMLGDRELHAAKLNKIPLGIILIDIDHFKQINDQYGHTTGDEVLKNVVQCFKKGIRADDILGRYGGEEFVVFLPRTDLPTAIQVAERLRHQLLEWSLPIDGHKITITASFGAHSAVPDSNTQIDALLDTADQALYRAKDSGRNRVAW